MEEETGPCEHRGVACLREAFRGGVELQEACAPSRSVKCLLLESLCGAQPRTSPAQLSSSPSPALLKPLSRVLPWVLVLFKEPL